MKHFKTRTAVITGAASGFGLETCRIAAREGMNIVMADVQADALERAAAEIRGLGAVANILTSDGARASGLCPGDNIPATTQGQPVKCPGCRTLEGERLAQSVKLNRLDNQRFGVGGQLQAFDIDALQLPIGKETDRLAVRRPEGKARAFGSWKRSA